MYLNLFEYRSLWSPEDQAFYVWRDRTNDNVSTEDSNEGSNNGAGEENKKSLDDVFIPNFLRTRKVTITKDQRLHCDCNFALRTRMPCIHEWHVKYVYEDSCVSIDDIHPMWTRKYQKYAFEDKEYDVTRAREMTKSYTGPSFRKDKAELPKVKNNLVADELPSFHNKPAWERISNWSINTVRKVREQSEQSIGPGLSQEVHVYDDAYIQHPVFDGDDGEMGKKFSYFDKTLEATSQASLKRCNDNKAYLRLKPSFDKLLHAAGDFEEAVDLAECLLDKATTEVAKRYGGHKHRKTNM